MACRLCAGTSKISAQTFPRLLLPFTQPHSLDEVNSKYTTRVPFIHAMVCLGIPTYAEATAIIMQVKGGRGIFLSITVQELDIGHCDCPKCDK